MTSTELATIQTPAPLVAGSTGANLIREAAAVMVDAHALASAVAGTQMIPKHFQGRPDECAAAMLYGASLGLDPMQSVRQIYVVHGQAALYARAMSALVLGAGHKVWTVESTDQSVTVSGSRRGVEHVETSTWTYDRAHKAGYTNNAKYKTDPQAMLYSKALSEVCRKIAPDVLSGVYAVEELQLEQPWDGTTRPPREVAASAADRMGAILSPTITAEQVHPQTGDSEGSRAETSGVEGEAGSSPAGTPSESPLLNTSSALAKAMYAAIKEHGVPEAERIAWLANVVGRELASSKEMTDAEARDVLAWIDANPSGFTPAEES